MAAASFEQHAKRVRLLVVFINNSRRLPWSSKMHNASEI